MYGYRQSTEETLMTNLNSISSSLSSIETIGTRRNVSNGIANNNNTKVSVDNLIRSQSVASTSLLWKGAPSKKSDRYAAAMPNSLRAIHGASAIGSSSKTCTPNSETALNLCLVPLLLLTILRQVFDFMGQIWLQILINFFTIILIIVALFGIRQHRISYLLIYLIWALFNVAWNVVVFCLHSKLHDVGMTENMLSLNTGVISWWQANGPGCLPYNNISSIQSSISIIKSNMITGCRWDYHIIEYSQAVAHAALSLASLIFCCCVIFNFRRYPSFYSKKVAKTEKLYQLNNLANGRTRINQDPLANHEASRYGSASLRRAGNKACPMRSSQHSVSSVRSVRRRNRSVTENSSTGVAAPRGSTSSAQRSQKYGSLSSRRSSNRRDRRGDIASLTYGTTSERPTHRSRLSSLSSADYLPSYQPPHSSSANLLSSYGEISSIDSYNNQNGRHGSRQTFVKSAINGNTNPTYSGSRSSIYSHSQNGKNYENLSNIYGQNGDNVYATSSSGFVENNPSRQHIYQDGSASMSRRVHNFRPKEPSIPQRITAETYQMSNSANT